MGLEINEEGMEELVEDQRQALPFEELVELHNEKAEALKQRIAFKDKDNLKFTAFQLRTLRRCSLAGINCPNS